MAAARLDLDHLGTEVGEQPPGEPAEPIGCVDDQDIGQQHLCSQRPLRASECTQPDMRERAFSMSFLLKKSSGLTLSTG